MWDRLRTQVTFERRQPRRLVDLHRSLLEKCAAQAPTDVELYAFAGLLHSFYNGAENIFKRTTLELGDNMPSSEFWHKELLDAMTQATPPKRPPHFS